MHTSKGINFVTAQGESSARVGMRLRAEICDRAIIEQDENILSTKKMKYMLSEAEVLHQRKAYGSHEIPGTEYPSAMGTLHFSSGITNRMILTQWKHITSLVNILALKCERSCKPSMPKGRDLLPTEKAAFDASKLLVKKIIDKKMKVEKGFAAFFTNIRDSGDIADSADACGCQLIQLYDKLSNWGIGPNGNIKGIKSDATFFQTAMRGIGSIRHLMRWVGVGQDHTCNFNNIEDFNTADQHKKGMSADWRALGLKVALYDDLRERRLTMPSGVEWAIPERQEWNWEIIPSSAWGDKWNFQAIFINKNMLETIYEQRTVKVVELNNHDKVGQWNIDDEDVALIILDDESREVDCGRDMWILSHLTYPLAAVVEGFQMGYITSTDHRFGQYFFRNSGLVDISSPYRKLIFVSISETNTITLGKKQYSTIINQTIDGPVVYEFDDSLKNIVISCLESTVSLKACFNAYAEKYFKGTLDWLEVELLTSYLTTRWVAQPEVTTDQVTDIIHWTLNESNHLYHHGANVQVANSRQFGDFGHQSGVLGFDHVVSSWKKARKIPVLTIGTWTKEVEVYCGLRFGQCSIVSQKSTDDTSRRLRAGGWDRLHRGCLMRIAFEEWKRAAGLRDEICCPHAYDGLETFWRRLVDYGEDGKCVKSIANYICVPSVRWSWLVNISQQIECTHTGFRGSVDWSKNWLSVEWEPFNFKENLEGRMKLCTNRNHWTYAHFVGIGIPRREEVLEQAMMRLDVNKWRGHIKYKSCQDEKQINCYAYRCESKATDRMHRWLGWNSLIQRKSATEGFGWGLRSHLNLWNKGGYVTIALTGQAGLAIQHTFFTETTWLARSWPTNTVVESYTTQVQYGDLGWDLSFEDVNDRYTNTELHPEKRFKSDDTSSTQGTECKFLEYNGNA